MYVTNARRFQAKFERARLTEEVLPASRSSALEETQEPGCSSARLSACTHGGLSCHVAKPAVTGMVKSQVGGTGGGGGRQRSEAAM